MSEQNYKNHAKYDPAFHVFLFGLILLLLGEAIWRTWKDPGVWRFVHLLYAVGAAVAIFLIRVYALKVQDRVIRLEERLRLQSLLSEPLRARIPELTVRQLVGLRFASDAEIPALVERALGGLSEKEIKQSIRIWRADHHRV